MENKVKQCKHNVKLAFNNDEIISYCDKCGKILDRYEKVNGHINYYTYPSYPYYNPVITCCETTRTISGNVGDQKCTLTGSELK